MYISVTGPSFVQVMASRIFSASHYQNQCYFVVNWAHGNKLRGKLKQNTAIFPQENEFEEVICKKFGNIVLASICKVTLMTYCFYYFRSWWRHQMEPFFALLAICAGNSQVSCEFPTQRPVTRSFDVFFDLHLNKRLSKQWRGWWFETPSCPLLRHRNVPWQHGLLLLIYHLLTIWFVIMLCCLLKF